MRAFLPRVTTAKISVLTFCIALSFACSQNETLESIERGKRVYIANCTACHALDPAQDGPVGPAIAGAPRELVAARVLRAEYPAGYTPKRASRAMPAMPHLANDIEALAAFLAETQ